MAGNPETNNPTFNYEDLETLAANQMVTVIDLINENIEGCDRDSVFIDTSLELEWPKAIEFCRNLAIILGDQEVADEEAVRTAYRAFHFAAGVSTIILNVFPQIYQDGYFEGCESLEDAAQRLTLDSQVYLQNRKAIDCLVAYYMPAISHDDRYAAMAEIVAAITFMFIDEYERDKAIENAVANFSMAIDTWSADITDTHN